MSSPTAVILYSVSNDGICTITLNRPDRLNAISSTLPKELRLAVEKADRDDKVKCIVVRGSGRAFCAGYDLQDFAERRGDGGNIDSSSTTKKSNIGASNGKTWDPTVDYRMMYQNTMDFMSLFRCTKPTISMVAGFAVAGGSDIALCADIVIMEDKAKIGYPPARVWGIPTTCMWPVRIGMEKAKYMLFTGNLIDGVEAKRIGLVHECVPKESLEKVTYDLARRIALVPRNQLMMSKHVINQAFEAQIASTQKWATLFDGIARYSPEGMHFKKRAEQAGFQVAVKERDGNAPFIPDDVSIPTFAFDDFNAIVSLGNDKKSKL
jgi:enoyl-CoA hydratase